MEDVEFFSDEKIVSSTGQPMLLFLHSGSASEIKREIR
jgi:hypothetical protein